MNSMRFLILLVFILYEMQSAHSTIKHLKYLKSLLMSKHLPSTTEQPIVEGEVYSSFVQCEPAEGDANVDTPIEWNPQGVLTNDQKPVLIEIENVETVPNIYPGQYYGILPDVNTEVNSGIIYEGNPEANYLKVYEKDLNPEWLASRVQIEQKPETVDIKKGVVSLKDKIREKINLIKSKLKLTPPEPRPVMEIIDQDSPFLPEEDNNNNNNYFQHTTGKPITTVESISTGKPILTIESISTERPISTIESITTGRPISTTEWITSQKPFSTIASITTEKPFSTIESITTGKPFSTMESITTEKPFSTIESITTGKPVISTESAVSTATAEPVVIIKPKLKPFLYAQMNFDKGSHMKPFSFALPAVPQTLQKVYHYSPLLLDNCLPPLTREMCRQRSILEYAPNPWAVAPKPLTLENTPYVMVAGAGIQDNSQNQNPAFDKRQQLPTVTNKFGNYYWGVDQRQQLTTIGINPSIKYNPAQRLPFIESINRPKPSTLENTPYVVVPAGGGRPLIQRPISIDKIAVINRFKDLLQPVTENCQEAQNKEHQQQQTPVVVVDQPQQRPVTEFENTYSGPTTAQMLYEPPTQGVSEVGTTVSATGQPIAVYPDIAVAPSSSPVEPSYPENDWTRNLAATPQQEVTADGPLRGDIPLGLDEYGGQTAQTVQTAVKYEPQDQNTTIERRQTKRDESMVVDQTESKKHVSTPVKISGPTMAKVATPIFESIVEEEKTSTEGSIA